tara:strand:- start:6 stop:500 length:495 start_codon:yes stop_codon:yes gene_type:complete
MASIFRRTPEGPARDAFWKRLEAELGAPIRAYALGQYLQGRDEPGPLWGLLYLTDEVLYFRHFAQVNWFSAFLSGGDEEDPEEARRSRPGQERNVVLEVRLTTVARVVPPERRRGLSRLLRGDDRVYRLESVYPTVSDFAFSLESRGEVFTRELQAALDRLQAG